MHCEQASGDVFPRFFPLGAISALRISVDPPPMPYLFWQIRENVKKLCEELDGLLKGKGITLKQLSVDSSEYDYLNEFVNDCRVASNLV